MRRWLLACIGVIAMTAPAFAEGRTAVCSNIRGMRVDDENGNMQAEHDEVKGATWTFTWNDAPKAVGMQMILQNSAAAGGRQMVQSGFRVADTREMVSFVSLPEAAVWTFTVYSTGRLLVTEHSTAPDGIHLSGKLMTGDCHPG